MIRQLRADRRRGIFGREQLGIDRGRFDPGGEGIVFGLADAIVRKAGLRLDVQESAGGELPSGHRAIVAGDAHDLVGALEHRRAAPDRHPCVLLAEDHDVDVERYLEPEQRSERGPAAA